MIISCHFNNRQQVLRKNGNICSVVIIDDKEIRRRKRSRWMRKLPSAFLMLPIFLISNIRASICTFQLICSLFFIAFILSFYFPSFFSFIKFHSPLLINIYQVIFYFSYPDLIWVPLSFIFLFFGVIDHLLFIRFYNCIL